ncbi:MAG: MAPEG family protein [Halobacteriovoraceae bacterium]|nr:MAPEG family protein [Halobacteriovoraceae bacterium]
MNISIFCVFIASLLPIFFIGFAKISGGFKLGYNHDPRKYLEKLEGKSHRAKCAHDNSWEAFAPFAAGVILAIASGVNPQTIDKLAISFVGIRVLYGLLYIYGQSALRSLVWLGGMICTWSLFYLAWT